MCFLIVYVIKRSPWIPTYIFRVALCGNRYTQTLHQIVKDTNTRNIYSGWKNMCCKDFFQTLTSTTSTWRPSHWAYFDRIRNSMKIQNGLVSNRFDQSQRYFAHVTTVTLSWRVQNIVVIGRVYLTLECFEFSSNFEFDRNMLTGTGARWTTQLNCVTRAIMAK